MEDIVAFLKYLKCLVKVSIIDISENSITRRHTDIKVKNMTFKIRSTINWTKV